MSVHYAIRHLTRFRYASPVSESVMELRMRPSNTEQQRCLQFDVDVQPRARVFAYRDFRGNWVHHFDIPRRHGLLAVSARAQVQLAEPQPLPERLPHEAWAVVDEWEAREEEWEYRQPSRFAEWSPSLFEFADSVDASRRRDRDPLTAVSETMSAIHHAFEYAPNSTRVDSPIAETLASRRGVCQDFTHIMIAIARQWGVPARYVSGYLFHRRQDKDRSSPDETHAWMEAYLPSLGWAGFDPTNNILVADRHVRVAVGRDYADVPPTRGTFKGNVESELGVAVRVESTSAPVRHEEFLRVSKPMSSPKKPAPTPAQSYYQQQQQQQQ